MSEADFLKAAHSGDENKTKEQRCEAYFYAGTMRLLLGDKPAAADYFGKCVDTGIKNFTEYSSAASEFKALKN